MQRWVLATSNTGKLNEFRHALAPVLGAGSIELVSASDLGIASPDEPFLTFDENALAKARHASAASGLPAIADDSGLCVAALDGRPGVRSARYWSDAAASCDPAQKAVFDAMPADEANLHWLLAEMQRQRQARYGQSAEPSSFWSAEFRAAIAFVRSASDPSPIVATGVWTGRLVPAPRGQGGFGYDPVFFDATLNCTAAEMTLDQKNSVSHRGKALASLMARLTAMPR